MLTQEEIQQRVTSLGCCSLDALYEYVQAKIYGEEKCAREKWRLFLYLRWAQTKMCDPCWTNKEKTDLARKVDCLCSPCGCPEPPEEDCVITPQFTVIDAIPEDDLPPDPDVGSAYYVTEGGNEGFIATWAESLVYEYTLVPNFSIIETDGGDLWTNTGNGPNLLFPSITLTLTGGPSVWTLEFDGPSVAQGRTIQLEGLGPNGWYAMWQGTEADVPLNVNLLGLPWTSVRARYILANGCEYPSTVGVAIPENPDTCGTITATLGEPESDAGEWTVPLTLSNQSGYPLGACLISIDETDPIEGPILTLGENILGPFLLGQTVQITVVNAANPDCNIALEPIVTECPVLVTNFEAITVCNGDGDPPIPLWGVAGTIEPNPDFPPGSVTYTTPLATDPVACNLVDGEWQCGPLQVEEDPGPMTISIESAINKNCDVVLGPFEPTVCGPCSEIDFPEGCQRFSFDYLGESEESSLILIIDASNFQEGNYMTVVAPDGEVYTVPSSDLIMFSGDTHSGSYCAYSSDENGVPQSQSWSGLNLIAEVVAESLITNLDLSEVSIVGVDPNAEQLAIQGASFDSAPDYRYMTGLQGMSFTDCSFVSLPVTTGMSWLVQYGIQRCGIAIAPSFVGLPNITALGLASNNLPVSEVNRVLQEASANFTSNYGSISIAAQTPSAPPDGAGLTAKAELEGRTPGWTVTVDT
jgi:hypothetical protein